MNIEIINYGINVSKEEQTLIMPLEDFNIEQLNSLGIVLHKLFETFKNTNTKTILYDYLEQVVDITAEKITNEIQKERKKGDNQ